VKFGELRILTPAEMQAAQEEAEKAAAERAEYMATLCGCKLIGTRPYLLTIEDNRIGDVACQGCGKSLMPEWIEDLLSTSAPLPVDIAWQQNGPHWESGETDWWGEIAPRLPVEIKTATELDALPRGAAVLDQDGDVWQRGHSWWFMAGSDEGEDSGYLVRHLSPLTLIHVPKVAPPAEPDAETAAESAREDHADTQLQADRDATLLGADDAR
jgi:hypothetical protein